MNRGRTTNHVIGDTTILKRGKDQEILSIYYHNMVFEVFNSKRASNNSGVFSFSNKYVPLTHSKFTLNRFTIIKSFKVKDDQIHAIVFNIIDGKKSSVSKINLDEIQRNAITLDLNGEIIGMPVLKCHTTLLR